MSIFKAITLIFCLSVIFSCSSDLPLDEKFESKVEKEKKEKEKKEKENEQSLNKGNLFLENNKKNTQVQVTASGLQYEVLREGLGPKPGPMDRVLRFITTERHPVEKSLTALLIEVSLLNLD